MTLLDKEFERIEEQMRNVLAKNRARFAHSGDKGVMAEDALRAVLREYLPRRLAIGHGEIIDSTGNRSGQTDIVIANEDHPFTFSEDLPGLFFAEGVVGAGEVKSVLTSNHLESTILNSRKFKNLAFAGPGCSVSVDNVSDFRYINSAPFFLFAYDSDLSLDTIHTRLSREVDPVNNKPLVNIIDAVFVLNKGWIINFGDGKETYQYRTEEGDSIPGWQRKESGRSLMPLMEWLSVNMPKINRKFPILTMYTMTIWPK